MRPLQAHGNANSEQDGEAGGSVSIVIHEEMVQGSEEWAAARCGLLTASEMKHVITATLKVANNDKSRGHFYELLAQRITRYVEPSYVSDAMLRGLNDEIEAVHVYGAEYAPVKNVGFITNDKWGFTIGYSPDGLVGNNGQVEVKSRKQSLQTKTILEYVSNETIDPDFMIQAQTGLMVSERDWVDLISYCGGMPMATVRVFPDSKFQDAIITAATEFESKIFDAMEEYQILLASKARLIPTERKINEVMV